MSKVSKTLAHNIDIIRNNVPYRKFSELILKKTGVRIGAATLQQYVSRLREPRNSKLEAIARYADKSISWLYEDHSHKRSDISFDVADDLGSSGEKLPSHNHADNYADLDDEYYCLAKEMQESKIPPDDIRKVIYALKALKAD